MKMFKKFLKIRTIISGITGSNASSRVTEKKIEFSFYLTTIIITWVMSTTIASLPLAKIGNYIYDTSCTSCELDWKMKPGSQTGFNISVIVLGGFIPILLM